MANKYYSKSNRNETDGCLRTEQESSETQKSHMDRNEFSIPKEIDIPKFSPCNICKKSIFKAKKAMKLY